MQTICVLGGTGFIGNHLIQSLSNKDNVYIKVLTRNERSQANKTPGIQWLQGDLLDKESLKIFLDSGSVVLNFAFLRNGSIEKNIYAAENLAKSCRDADILRLIHCSTAMVTGMSTDDIITESTPCNPVLPYEKVKLEIERIFTEAARDSYELGILRPTVVFGKGGKNLVKHAKDLLESNRIINILRLAILQNRKMNLVSIHHVVDAVSWMIHLDRINSPDIYIISDDENRNNNYIDVCSMLCKYFGIKPITNIKIPFADYVLQKALKLKGRTNVNLNRIYSEKKILSNGFKKHGNFKEHIKEFAEWYKEINHLNFQA